MQIANTGIFSLYPLSDRKNEQHSTIKESMTNVTFRKLVFIVSVLQSKEPKKT